MTTPTSSSTGVPDALFTGIIESVGEVVSVAGGERGRIVAIAAPFVDELSPGQSVAVDGACLTVRDLGTGTFTVEAGASTLQRTIASGYRAGSRVNLERAVRAGDRMDGHLVQGHVDGKATLVGVERAGDTRLLDFRLPGGVFDGTVPRGSIALNGASLTVNGLEDGGVCQVALIPYSWEHTNFSSLVQGDHVNVEADLIGKYVKRIMEARSSAV
ncbi:MAG: riboflavin synthase [Gemmatimonadetes bacterium]|nr:riboflavin synthase [Gemmatimonadota bacterium]MYD13564.1 riboflavin synthase [Gemmatimonadota bacterium]MYE68429.1 riboflavin synthase [Gemmatimonadota bacterium]MYI64627.1 riboflavin synthase [Gemmatimonadota bacterium]MYJ69945.1 riboflavin synthase [Gemmatimonadota bacterium]